MELTSLNNDKVKFWSKLKVKKYRDEEKIFLIEGDHLVNIALDKNLVIDLICIDDIYDFNNKYLVTEDIMKKISNQQSISRVAATVKFIDVNYNYNSNVLALDNLQDPGNLGTIIRSAVAFGFNNIILGDGTVDLYNDKVIRASEGMIFNLNIVKRNLVSELENLKNQDYTVVGTDVHSGQEIKNITEDKLVIVIGNEGKGMSNEIPVDHKVKIPMTSDCESINAAVSASILMYEVYSGR